MILRIWRIIYPFLLLLLCQLVGSLACGIFGVYDTNVILIVYSVMAIFLLGIFFRQDKKEQPEQQVQTVKPLHYVLFFIWGMGISIFMSFVISNLDIAQAVESHEDVVSNLLSSDSFVIKLVSVGILTPITEEICFRGLIFGRVRAKRGFWLAALVSSLMFGLSHVGILQMVYSAVFALILAFAYEKMRNIAVPCCVHMGFNILSVLFDSFPDMVGEQWAAAVVLTACVIALGGFALLVKFNVRDKEKSEKIS